MILIKKLLPLVYKLFNKIFAWNELFVKLNAGKNALRPGMIVASAELWQLICIGIFLCHTVLKIGAVCIICLNGISLIMSNLYALAFSQNGCAWTIYPPFSRTIIITVITTALIVSVVKSMSIVSLILCLSPAPIYCTAELTHNYHICHIIQHLNDICNYKRNRKAYNLPLNISFW